MIAIHSYTILFRDEAPAGFARGGIGVSHAPTIGFAYDTDKQNDPARDGAQ